MEKCVMCSNISIANYGHCWQQQFYVENNNGFPGSDMQSPPTKKISLLPWQIAHTLKHTHTHTHTSDHIQIETHLKLTNRQISSRQLDFVQQICQIKKFAVSVFASFVWAIFFFIFVIIIIYVVVSSSQASTTQAQTKKACPQHNLHAKKKNIFNFIINIKLQNN